MATSYNKLWKLLIDKGMRKKDLQLAAGISSGVITKMGKGEAVTTTVLAKDLQSSRLQYWGYHGICR